MAAVISKSRHYMTVENFKAINTRIVNRIAVSTSRGNQGGFCVVRCHTFSNSNKSIKREKLKGEEIHSDISKNLQEYRKKLIPSG